MFPTYLYKDDVEAAQDALRGGLDPDIVFLGGWRALHFNSISARMVELFVDWGADIDAFDHAVSIGYVRAPLSWSIHKRCMLNNGADPRYNPSDIKDWREIDEFKARRDAVLVLLLSTPGLSRGLALRVGWWVLQTH